MQYLRIKQIRIPNDTSLPHKQCFKVIIQTVTTIGKPTVETAVITVCSMRFSSFGFYLTVRLEKRLGDDLFDVGDGARSVLCRAGIGGTGLNLELQSGRLLGFDNSCHSCFLLSWYEKRAATRRLQL